MQTHMYTHACMRMKGLLPSVDSEYSNAWVWEYVLCVSTLSQMHIHICTYRLQHLSGFQLWLSFIYSMRKVTGISPS